MSTNCFKTRLQDGRGAPTSPSAPLLTSLTLLSSPAPGPAPGPPFVLTPHQEPYLPPVSKPRPGDGMCPRTTRVNESCGSWGCDVLDSHPHHPHAAGPRRQMTVLPGGDEQPFWLGHGVEVSAVHGGNFPEGSVLFL